MPYNKEEKKPKPEYTLLILPSAQKQLDKLPNNTATRIEDKILELEHNPRPQGCKKLKGRDAYRIRIGDYRAVPFGNLSAPSKNENSTLRRSFS